VKLTEENLINWIKEISPVEIKLPPKYYMVSKVQPGIAGGVCPLEVSDSKLNISCSVSTYSFVDYETKSIKILFCCIEIESSSENPIYFKKYKTFTIQDLDYIDKLLS
jgi:hypothetical protein